MPRINLSRHNQPSIGEMRDLVWICTTTERPDDFVSTIVERPGVFRCHARIRDIRQAQILDYKAVMGDQDTPTKEVTIRVPPDARIDLGYWIYRDGPIAKMWLKVRNIEDLGEVRRFLVLQCSVDTVNDARSDSATQQSPPIWENPALLTPDLD